MKLEKIDYPICCDVPGCGALSTYKLTFGDKTTKIHICATCRKKLLRELKKFGQGE